MKKHLHLNYIVFTVVGIFVCLNSFSQLSYLGKVAQHEDGVYGLVGTMSICFSNDKSNLYMSSQYALAVFDYDESTGSTDFIEAYRGDDNGNYGLYSPGCIAISPDDRFLYVTSDSRHCISLYQRNNFDGTLELVKIFHDTDDGFDGLRGAHEVGITGDGEFLYVAAWNDAKISAFKRDNETGYITYIHSVNRYDEGGLSWPKSLKLSRDSKFVYVASHMDDKVSVFEIDQNTGELLYIQTVNTVDGHYSFTALEISYDNEYLYLAGRSSLGFYKRNIANGKLTLNELILHDNLGVSGLKGIYSLSVTPDDKNIYAITSDDSSFVTFYRNEYDDFQFIDTKPFMTIKYYNNGYSTSSLTCDNNYVFGNSYWEKGTHCATRNQPDGSLTYNRFIFEGKESNIDGLYNPRDCCVDDIHNMAYVSTNSKGISIFQSNDTTGKLIYRNVANNQNQSTSLLSINYNITVSKDGNYLYTLSSQNETSGMAIFKVDHDSYDITLIDSIMSDYNGSTGFNVPVDMEFSPLGEHLYVVSSFGHEGIAQYSYSPDNGLVDLMQFYAIDNTGNHSDNICLSKDGRYAFVWNNNTSYIVMLKRNTFTGELTYLSTFSTYFIGDTYLNGLVDIALSSDLKNLYATYEDSDVFVVYNIDTLNSELVPIQVYDYDITPIEGLQRIQHVEVRDDGTFVYTSSFENNSIGLYYRDQETGMLTFLKDYTELEYDFDGLDKINVLCNTVDDRNLYSTSSAEEAIASFSIDLYLGPDREICENDSVLLDAGKGYLEYQWSTGDATRKVYVKNEGYYYIKTTDEFGFNDYDTIYVTVNQKPELELGPDIEKCIGNHVTLNSGSTGYNIWNTGSESDFIVVSNTGTYSVIIIDDNGCCNEDSINVTFQELPEVELGNDTIIGIEQTLVLSVDSLPGYNYLWYDGSSNPYLIITSELITDNPTKVWVEVTSDINCINSDTVHISVDKQGVIHDRIEVKISPIPTDDLSNIESNYVMNDISCFDTYGKYLFTVKPVSTNYTLSTRNLSEGTYYLRISFNNGKSKSYKVIRL